jgi:hypothetical protein
MARIRTIKPEFWTSEQVVECSPIARLLFVGMWNFCDDGGNYPASAKTLKMQIFPGDDIAITQIESMIRELTGAGLLLEYAAKGRQYWNVTGWKHQKIDKPSFKHPQPFDDDSTIIRRALDDCHPAEGKGREGKGKEPMIPLPPKPADDDQDEIPTPWTIDPRHRFAMPPDWQPTDQVLKGYIAGKTTSADGKPLTADRVMEILPHWREEANASANVMTDAQWTLRLVRYAMAYKHAESRAQTTSDKTEKQSTGPVYKELKPGPPKVANDPNDPEWIARQAQYRSMLK